MPFITSNSYLNWLTLTMMNLHQNWHLTIIDLCATVYTRYQTNIKVAIDPLCNQWVETGLTVASGSLNASNTWVMLYSRCELLLEPALIKGSLSWDWTNGCEWIAQCIKHVSHIVFKTNINDALFQSQIKI